MRTFWLALILLLEVPAWAQVPSEGREGDFGGNMFIIADLDDFWTTWDKPENPTVNTTSKVTHSRPVYAIVVFHDCKAGPDGKCKVTVRFDMTGPDGKPYDEPHGGTAWNNPPAPDHNLLASVASMGFRLEPQDKFGRYEIKATLTDEVADRSVILREIVTAEAESGESSPTT